MTVNLRLALMMGAAALSLAAPAFANTVTEAPAATTPAPATPAPAAKVAAPAPVTAAIPAAVEMPRLLGELQTTTTKYEDTLVHMARKYNVGFVEIRAANPGVDPWLPGAGTRIVVPTQHILPDAPQKGVVINLSEMRIYFYEHPGEMPATYPIGIGRSGLTTPLGTTYVARKNVDPVWFPTERMRREDPELPAAVPPGPENPMGTHAMYLGWASYAIHGTDKPYSIGRRLSSGCIRMYPEDIITLFDRVPQGTMVTVVDQPVKTAWVDNKFYLEVHPTQEQSDILSHDNASLPDYQMSEADMRTILKGAGPYAENLDWAKIRQAVKERRGVPMIVATRDNVPKDNTAPVIAADKAVQAPAAKVDKKAEAAPQQKSVDGPIPAHSAVIKASDAAPAAPAKATAKAN